MKRRGNLLLLGASLLACLFVLELVLRLTGLGFSSSFYTLDLYRGWALRPGTEAWQRDEGEAYIRINRDGMRDRERNVVKPAGTFRIAVLGDSFTEALQVPLEQTFTAVLERDLAACAALAGRPVEVLNFGVGGYGTAQELLTLRRVAREYRPDIVVLAFLTGNDVYNNHRGLNPTNADAAPYFIYEDGRLVLREAFGIAEPGPTMTALRDFSAKALGLSRLLQAGGELFYGYWRRGKNQLGPRAEFGSDYMDRLVYSPPEYPAMRAAWRVTEGLLVQFHNDVRALGAEFLLVSLSNSIQVHPDKTVRREFLRRIGAQDLLYPDLRLKALWEREGIRGLLLAPPLLEYAERNGAFLHGFPGGTLGTGHWNETGHRVAGQVLTGEICRSRDTRSPATVGR